MSLLEWRFQQTPKGSGVSASKSLRGLAKKAAIPTHATRPSLNLMGRTFLPMPGFEVAQWLIVHDAGG